MKSSRSILRALSRFVLRRAGWVALFGSGLALLGGYYTIRLYSEMKTNLEELLPSSARSVIDLKQLETRVASVENLVVLALSAHSEDSKRFVIDLAARLATLPKSLISGVEYRMDTELAFFRQRLPFFVATDDLLELRDYVQKRILYEKDQQGLGLGLFDAEPQFDLEGFKKKYAGKTSSYDRFPDGFYASLDQTKRAILVHLPGNASDIESAIRVKQAVENAVKTLTPKSYAPDLEIRYTGNAANLIEEHAALVADLKFTTTVVILLVAAAMFLFYRSFWATVALVVSLLMGTGWTLGLSYFVVGNLNANSAFLGSIVIGNGINFGIIFLARYLEERRARRSNSRAILTAMQSTSSATLTAALAAGLAYGSLMLTSFRGFNQFGIIGLIGMLLCWLSAYTLLPSFLTLLDRWRGICPQEGTVPRAILSESVAGFVSRHPRSITVFSVGLTGIAILTFFVHDPHILEFDMNKLRDKHSMRSGSGLYYHHIADIFGKNLSPMVLLTPSREDARRVAASLREKMQADPVHSQIAWVQTLSDLVPGDQKEKLEILKDFRKILSPATIKLIPQELSPWAEILVGSSYLPPFTEADLPPLVLSRFTEKDGTRGRIVLFDKPVVAPGKEENALETVGLISEVRSTADRVSPGSVLAGQLPITADMISAIIIDGPRATLFACLAVLLLVVFLFRSVRTIAVVSFALWVGVIWLAGIILGANLRINFLNFIALPITFGIGIDYGVNIFQRYREEGSRSILRVIRNTGPAVGLCSLTTIIGYSSLLLASNQAFVSFGMLAVLGEVCCLLAAVISLPAYLLSGSKSSA